MIPKELQRDQRGLTRLQRIELADKLIAEARRMANAVIADQERGFAAFADDSCDECSSQNECGYKRYVGLLLDASESYAAAGLLLLSYRVERLANNCVTHGWNGFDQANATTGF